jgi:hypothetical protein
MSCVWLMSGCLHALSTPSLLLIFQGFFFFCSVSLLSLSIHHYLCIILTSPYLILITSTFHLQASLTRPFPYLFLSHLSQWVSKKVSYYQILDVITCSSPKHGGGSSSHLFRNSLATMRRFMQSQIAIRWFCNCIRLANMLRLKPGKLMS